MSVMDGLAQKRSTMALRWSFKEPKKHPNQSDERRKQAGWTSDAMVTQSRQFTNYGCEAFLVETLKAK